MPGLILPIEICEIVIDNIHDPGTHRACSLTCGAFLPASRRSLFYHVDLFNRYIAQSFLDIICSAPFTTSPIRYIRSLCLREKRTGDEWVNRALPILAERLPDFVISLELENLLWNLPENIGQIPILSRFLKVRNLEMPECKFGSSEQMNQFIASFPSLVDLDCSKTYWSIENPLTLTADLPQTLRSLYISSEHTPFFYHLLRRELHPRVPVLYFLFIDLDDTEEVGILLKEMGSSLESLSFGELYIALQDSDDYQGQTLSIDCDFQLCFDLNFRRVQQ